MVSCIGCQPGQHGPSETFSHCHLRTHLLGAQNRPVANSGWLSVSLGQINSITISTHSLIATECSFRVEHVGTDANGKDSKGVLCWWQGWCAPWCRLLVRTPTAALTRGHHHTLSPTHSLWQTCHQGTGLDCTCGFWSPGFGHRRLRASTDKGLCAAGGGGVSPTACCRTGHQLCHVSGCSAAHCHQPTTPRCAGTAGQ